MFALGLAVSLAPASQAEDQPSAQPATATATTTATASQPTAAQPATDTQARLEELQKEIATLQTEITALKDDSTPAVKTAAYAQPAPGAAVFSPDAQAPATPPAISISSLLGGITLSGFGDVYYGYDYNHPFDNMAGLRSFESPTNGFNFNMAELILDKPADATSAEGRLGYHVSAGYGSAARVVNGSDDPFGDGSNFFVKEAYFDYIAPIGKGLTITVGKFVTPMGAEVIESNANWNYSRGILFDYAIPFFHFGANAKYTFNPKWAVTGYLVNGWNNTIIDHNVGFGVSSGLTYGGSVVYTPNAKWSATENYFAGPVTDNYGSSDQTINDWKQISDTVIAYTPNAQWAFQVNGDYGFGPRLFNSSSCDDAVVSEGGTSGCRLGPKVSWWGGAGYAKYTMSPKTNFAVRYEYYDDPNGYTGLVGFGYGAGDGFGYAAWAQEVTGTISYNLTSALLIRGEYRYDFSNQPIFDKADDVDAIKYQNTATLSFVYTFSSANLK